MSEENFSEEIIPIFRATIYVSPINNQLVGRNRFFETKDSSLLSASNAVLVDRNSHLSHIFSFFPGTKPSEDITIGLSICLNEQSCNIEIYIPATLFKQLSKISSRSTLAYFFSESNKKDHNELYKLFQTLERYNLITVWIDKVCGH